VGNGGDQPTDADSRLGPPRGAVSARHLEQTGDSADASGGVAAGGDVAGGDVAGAEEPSPPAGGGAAPLIADPGRYQARWSEIQITFVDSPREAVRDASALVADVVQDLVDGFTKQRGNLEAQWDRGDEVSTEQLRVALQRYRAFFERLLAT
jgi:hypothetical protein